LEILLIFYFRACNFDFFFQVENDSQEEKSSFIFQNFVPELNKLNQDSNEKIDVFTVNDKVFHANYGINKFPQILFYRNGNYLTYNGYLTIKITN